MPNQNSIFQKPLFKILSLVFAFSALTVSIIFSQSNSQPKKDKKKTDPIIYESSKSGLPPSLKKEENPAPQKESNSVKEQTNNNSEVKLEEDKKESTQKPKNKEQDKKKSPIMPSSKAPDPSRY